MGRDPGFADPRHPPSAGARGRVRRYSANARSRFAQGAGSARHPAALHRTRRRPSSIASQARTSWSSRPPPAAKRSATTCRCSNLLIATIRARAPCICFPPRLWPKISFTNFRRRWNAMGSEIRAFTYDGDTPQDARRAIRQRANIVLTNPDMLHSGILPHHTKWAKLFREPALHRDRRAALLSRRLRQPSGEHAAAAAADLRVLWIEAAIHLLLGHHRQSAGSWPRR